MKKSNFIHFLPINTTGTKTDYSMSLLTFQMTFYKNLKNLFIVDEDESEYGAIMQFFLSNENHVRFMIQVMISHTTGTIFTAVCRQNKDFPNGWENCESYDKRRAEKPFITVNEMNKKRFAEIINIIKNSVK
jgi:hypothetical protein